MLAAVEEMLDGWPGTLILVTHDRFLMERVTDHQFALMDGKLRHLPRGVDEYLELAERAQSSGEEASPAAVPQVEVKAAPEDAAPALSNAERHRLERKMETARGRIQEAQAVMLEVDPTDFAALTEAQAAVTATEAALSQLEEEWLEASEQLSV